LTASTIASSVGDASAMRAESSITGNSPCGSTRARCTCSSCVAVSVSVVGDATPVVGPVVGPGSASLSTTTSSAPGVA
jgi:hypothetical protein